MDDIVERLNNAINPCTDYVVTIGDVAGAIQEINRLRHENADSNRAATFWKTAAQEAAEEFKSAEALLDTERELKTDFGKQIDRLRAEVASLKEDLDKRDTRIEQLEWENRGIAEWRNEWEKASQQLAAAQEQIALLGVQGQRFREALLQIAEDKHLSSDDPGYWKQRWQEIARAAISAQEEKG